MKKPTLLMNALFFLWGGSFGLWMWGLHMEHKGADDLATAQTQANQALLTAIRFGARPSAILTQLNAIVTKMIAIDANPPAVLPAIQGPRNRVQIRAIHLPKEINFRPSLIDSVPKRDI